MSRVVFFKDKTFKVIEEYKNGLTQYVIHLYSNKLWYPYRDANNTIVVFYDVDVAKTHALNMDKQNNE